MPTAYDTQQGVSEYHKRRHLLTKAYRAAKRAGRTAGRSSKTRGQAADHFLQAAGILEQGAAEGVKVGGIDSYSDINQKVEAQIQSRSALSDQAASLLGPEFEQGSLFSDGLSVQDRYVAMRSALGEKAAFTKAGADIAGDEVSTERAQRELEALEGEDTLLGMTASLDPMGDDFEERLQELIPGASMLDSVNTLVGMKIGERERNFRMLDAVTESSVMAGKSEEEVNQDRATAAEMLRNRNMTGVRIMEAHNRKIIAMKGAKRKTTGGKAAETQAALEQFTVPMPGRQYVAEGLASAVPYLLRDDKVPPGLEGFKEFFAEDDMDALADHVMAAVAKNPLIGRNVDTFVAAFLTESAIDDTDFAENFLKNLYTTVTEAQASDLNKMKVNQPAPAQTASQSSPVDRARLQREAAANIVRAVGR